MPIYQYLCLKKELALLEGPSGFLGLPLAPIPLLIQVWDLKVPVWVVLK